MLKTSLIENFEPEQNIQRNERVIYMGNIYLRHKLSSSYNDILLTLISTLQISRNICLRNHTSVDLGKAIY